MALDFFPHRPELLARLERIRAVGRLGQPLLLVGPEGAGKETTALEFARRLNCAAPGACSAAAPCESCAKAATFQHPDIRWIGPAPANFDESRTAELLAAKVQNPFFHPHFASTSDVSIGAQENPGPMTVRALIQFLQRRAFQGKVKVAVVADSQRLNAAAGNAFLKTLEEPPSDSIIILLATETQGMLPTILSRCQEIKVHPWPQDQLAALLGDLTGCAPGDAADAARVADGNARRAVALLQDISPVVREVALAWGRWILEGKRGSAAILADQVHRGAPPHILDPAKAAVWKQHGKESGSRRTSADDGEGEGEGGGGGGREGASGTAVRRDLAIQLCEWLILLYSEILRCREWGGRWDCRLPGAADFIRAAAIARSTGSLLADIALIESARDDIDRNLNIGLLLAVLGEGLIDHAEKDQARVRAARS